MNPLLEKFDTPYNSVPFDKIKNEHYLPAIKEAISLGKAEIDSIKNNPDTANFANTIEALEETGGQVDVVAGVFFNLHIAESSDELRDLAKKISPLVSDYSNEIILDEALFNRIKFVYENEDRSKLNEEEVTLLENAYKNFTRNGALLSEEDKNKVKTIDKRMSELSLIFSDNVLKDNNTFLMVVDSEDKLSGLPQGTKDAAKILAEEKGKTGWVFNFDYPSYIPFMTYADNRELREEMFKARGKIAYGSTHNKDTDNSKNVNEIVKLRHDRAKILGYSSHSDFVLERRMAESKTKVLSFLSDIKKKALPVAKREIEELKAFAKDNGGPDELMGWDSAYYFEKLKKAKFDIDNEVLKPYFKLENVINGIFQVAEKLYGLTYTENNEISKYHKDVRVYTVTNESKEEVGLFYADYFPREGKRSGAWMTSYRDLKNTKGDKVTPHVSIVCNFTKPTEKLPSLLTFNEVTTLFHEFGHSLHGILADTHYSSIAGTNVYWDFVELPSQVLENWAFEKECLDLFATHYETKEMIPIELIEKIKASANFHEGSATLRQLSLGVLDMTWHQADPGEILDIEKFEQDAIGEFKLLPKVAGMVTSNAFSHIFAGGYSAGYYSYKWAEVLDADAFEYFKEKGIFNKEVATKFKENVLSKGGTAHPSILYERFRGKAPSVDALMKRAGLV
jgi:Zn-dependent oligopeptidase